MKSTTVFAFATAALILAISNGAAAQSQAIIDPIATKYSNYDLLLDSPLTTAQDVVLMASAVSLDFQSNLIRRLVQSGVNVFVTSPPSLASNPKVDGLRKLDRTNVIDVNFQTGLWTQDRFVRFIDRSSGRSVLLPTLADSMNDDHAIAGYELAVPLALGASHPSQFLQLEDYLSHDSSIVSIDRGRGDLYVGANMPNFVHGVEWRMAYGDGGDRLVTEHYMLIGQATYEKLMRKFCAEVKLTEASACHSLFEKMLKKVVIPVGDSNYAENYLFHLDMFLTPFESKDGKLKVLFGSAQYGMDKIVGVHSSADLPSWTNSFYLNKKLAAEKRMKAQLDSLGIEAIDIPLFFIEPEAFSLNTGLSLVVGYNNGIFANRHFFAARYASQDQVLSRVLAKAEKDVEDKFKSLLNTDIEWISGGESIAQYGGGVRCMTGITRQKSL